MNPLMRLAEVVGDILDVFLGCCFSTPIDTTLREHPYLRFYA